MNSPQPPQFDAVADRELDRTYDAMDMLQEMAKSKDTSYNLFLDDERDPGYVTWAGLPKGLTWVIARSGDEFAAILNELGCPTRVSFDYNLGLSTSNGLTCVNALISYCTKHNLEFPAYHIHTANSSMGLVMEETIEKYKNAKNTPKIS